MKKLEDAIIMAEEIENHIIELNNMLKSAYKIGIRMDVRAISDATGYSLALPPLFLVRSIVLQLNQVKTKLENKNGQT